MTKREIIQYYRKLESEGLLPDFSLMVDPLEYKGVVMDAECSEVFQAESHELAVLFSEIINDWIEENIIW